MPAYPQPLHQYLVQQVSVPDLLRFLSIHYSDIVSGLPSPVVGADQYVFAVIERLRQYGYLDERLFLRLGEGRPGDSGLRTAAVAVIGHDPFAPGPGAREGKQVVLILMACPADQVQLDLTAEAAKIEDQLGLGQVRDRFNLVWGWSVSAEQTFDLIIDHSPHLVHFAGHGGRDGTLLLVGAAETTTRLRYDAVARLLGALRHPPRCVVLNACFSGLSTMSLTEHVDAVVGMRDEISDAAALVFSRYLYRSIARGKDLKESFDIARAATGALDPPSDHLPQLSCRAGIDPAKIRF